MTHKEIAKIANVSASTVSKALSGSREISRELSEKIVKIAIETGYFKEKSIRRLEYMKEKNPTVAILCPELLGTQYSRMVTSVKNEVEKRGGNVAVYVYDFDHGKMNDIVTMLAVKNSADAMVIISSKKPDTEPKIPICCFGDSEKNTGYDSLCCETKKTMELIVKHLKKLGHTKIAYMGEQHTMSKLSSFKQVMEECCLDVDERHIYISKKRFEGIGYECTEKMLGCKELPTAVVAAYDEIAIAAIHMLEKNGIRVPEDISVVGINNIAYSEYCSPPLTTVEIFSDEQCSAIVESLFEKIFYEMNFASYIETIPKLIVRKTTAFPK